MFHLNSRAFYKSNIDKMLKEMRKAFEAMVNKEGRERRRNLRGILSQELKFSYVNKHYRTLAAAKKKEKIE